MLLGGGAELRAWSGKRLTQEEQEGTFWVDVNVLYLGLGVAYVSVIAFVKIMKSTFNIYAFYYI